MSEMDANTQEIRITGDAEPTEAEEKRIRPSDIIKWGSVALFFLVVFTFFKIPEARIKNLIQGHLSATLAQQGVSLMAQETDLSLGFGAGYAMKNVTLRMAGSPSPIELDEIRVSPSFTKLLVGKPGGTAFVKDGAGTLDAKFAGIPPEIDFEFGADRMDLGSLRLLEMMADLKGGMTVSGRGNLTGNLDDPPSLNGEITLDLKDIVIDRQTFYGFTIPRLSISKGTAVLDVSDGKARIKTLQLGTAGNAQDDITANVTGTVALGKQLESSTLNLKASFTLSQKIKSAFALIDTFLQPGKKPDGSYAYLITGPVSMPNPTPAK